jgi:hypothetical protein
MVVGNTTRTELAAIYEFLSAPVGFQVSINMVTEAIFAYSLV